MVEREELIFDFSEYDGSPNSSSPCTARYFISNPTENRINQRFYFLSPSVRDVVVFVEGNQVSGKEEAADEALGNALEDAGIRTGDGIEKAVLFHTEFGPGQQVLIGIRFSILPGWDITVTEFGPTAPQAAHLTNIVKQYAPPSWYVYNLNAAATFSSFGELEVRILLPEEKDLIANIDFERENAGHEGIVQYTAETRGILRYTIFPPGKTGWSPVAFFYRCG